MDENKKGSIPPTNSPPMTHGLEISICKVSPVFISTTSLNDANNARVVKAAEPIAKEVQAIASKFSVETEYFNQKEMEKDWGFVAFNVFYQTLAEPLFWFALAMAWLTVQQSGHKESVSRI